jgi:tRNA threonylcarbamoyladenosine biosynthesis protein TsaE
MTAPIHVLRLFSTVNTPAQSEALHVAIPSESDMDALGRTLADLLQSGDVVCLDGPLGAGKTRLVRAIVAALNCRQLWSGSPTFVLVQEYDGQLPVYHMDAYRLKDSREFLDLGGDDYLASDGVCLIEWSQRIAEVLPKDALHIEIDVTSPTTRQLIVRSGGPRSQALLSVLARRI